jgi:hypothetical protein
MAKSIHHARVLIKQRHIRYLSINVETWSMMMFWIFLKFSELGWWLRVPEMETCWQ